MNARSQGSATGVIAPGAVVGGRYRLEERIGAGGMAVIYRARDLRLERTVAVKVLHAHLADDPVVLQRFRSEARLAAGLSHPHVVGVYDQGVADLPYIVMEHVDGPSLRQVLNDRGRLTPGEMLSLVEPVCRALARAHATGLVHRDVKPENLLVDTDGVPKIADFGIARAVADASMTQTGTFVGSVHYVAPELVDGHEATPRSDQYAVGVLVFEVLTGRKPLPAESPMAVALRHAKEPVPPPSDFVSDVPSELDAVVGRATSIDPAGRYPDVTALAEALGAAVPSGPQPVVIRREGPDDEDATLVVPAGGEAPEHTMTTLETPRAARRPRASARPAWRRAAMVVLWVLLTLAVLGGAGWAAWNFGVAPVRQVPQLVGLHVDEATAALDRLGLELVSVAHRHELRAPEGQVLDQSPAPGAELRRGDQVAVVLSLGPEHVRMPPVLGTPLEEARAQLEGPPFFFIVAELNDFHHDTVPAGHVIGQAPESGVDLRAGDEVRLAVSLGIEQVTVPDLAGLDREQAAAALDEALLVGDFVEEWSDEVPDAGMVVSQSLEPHAQVDKGSAVEVVISRGPLTVTLPDVRGQGVEAGRAELEALGLAVRVVGQARPRVGPFRRGEFGRVEEQVPEPGTRVRRGETVTLYTFTAEAEDD